MTPRRTTAAPLGPVLGESSKEIQFGKYMLLRKIAVGGMAEVYLAKSFGQFGFEKPVVIKVLLPRLSANEEFREMFVREALMAADFRHPRLCQVYDVGEAAGLYYICMEFVDGVDLTRLVRRARAANHWIPMSIALRIARDLTEGLTYVHNAAAADGVPLNIVHRDVTPQNIMVAFNGQVKLVDFGVAKTSLAEELKRSTLKGKGPYMAPEQWRGNDVDHRADLFAMGIVLYELTVGKRLFKRGNPDMVRRAILSGDITPPSAIRADFPPMLEKVVMRCLALDPADRYQSAAELNEKLDFVSEVEGLGANADEMGRYATELFTGVSRDEVFRPLELTAPGHAAEAAQAIVDAERDLTSDSLELPTPLPSARRHTALHKILLVLLLGGALTAAYGLGTSGWLTDRARKDAPPRLGPGPATASAMSPVMAPGMAPAVVAAGPVPLSGPTPEALKGCTATFGSVTVDSAGHVTTLDPERVAVHCPSKPGPSPGSGPSADPTSRALAADALRAWRFRPIKWGGGPVTTTTPVTLSFGP